MRGAHQSLTRRSEERGESLPRRDQLSGQLLAQRLDIHPATVNFGHDGDRLFLTAPADTNLKVRLLAVDTPEISDNLECMGPEATEYLRTMLPDGSTVYTQPDVEPLDQYGRCLLSVWTSSGQLVNLALAADVYAEAVFIGGNRILEAQVEAEDDAARGAGLGIWRLPNGIAGC